VQVEYSKTDKYGRIVGKVLVNGMDANLEQIKAGFAWHYKEYAAEQPVADRAVYANAETVARSANTGLWRDAKPMPPWDWRHGGKNESTAESSASGCACGGTATCTGKRGGQYCVAPNGKKKYQ
jgi:micrococcal nuclease